MIQKLKAMLLCSAAACVGVISTDARSQDVSFRPHLDFPTGGSNPSSVAVGDFNGDEIDDLVVTNLNSNTVSVLLGKGDGDFEPARIFSVGCTSPQAVAVGDFDKDGNLDAAVACSNTTNVAVLFGNGDGSFFSSQQQEECRSGRQQSEFARCLGFLG